MPRNAVPNENGELRQIPGVDGPWNSPVAGHPYRTSQGELKETKRWEDKNWISAGDVDGAWAFDDGNGRWVQVDDMGKVVSPPGKRAQQGGDETRLGGAASTMVDTNQVNRNAKIVSGTSAAVGLMRDQVSDIHVAAANFAPGHELMKHVKECVNAYAKMLTRTRDTLRDTGDDLARAAKLYDENEARMAGAVRRTTPE